MTTAALLFDMDGTMVDSMACHGDTWAVFAQRHGIPMARAEILRRTTGRNGLECIRELFGQDTREERCWALIAEKKRYTVKRSLPSFARWRASRNFLPQRCCGV